MPWNHDGSSIARPRNIISEKGYRGINVLALWVAARHSGYADGTWGTYQQWSQLGCQVRRGEKATTVVFWKQMRKEHRSDADPSGAADDRYDEREDRPRFFARGYIPSSTPCRSTATHRPTFRACPIPSASHARMHFSLR
jgi:antirestriction protein ArdC